MVSYIRSQITIKKGPLLRKGLEKLWKLFKYPIYLEYMKLSSQLVECLSPIAILTIPCSKKSIQLLHDASCLTLYHDGSQTLISPSLHTGYIVSNCILKRLLQQS